MATITTRSLVDPNDDSIETSLRRFEQKLRWWSPLLLGFFQTFWPYAYRAAVGISTIVGYLMFFIPSLLGASVITDVVLGEALFTTLQFISTSLYTVVSTLPFVEPLVTIGLLILLYAILLFDHDPEEPNGTRESKPYNWQRLRNHYIPSLLVFIAGSTLAVTSITPNGVFIALLGAWWVNRRLTFTIVGDEALYLVEPPYTEALLLSRVPFGMGVLLLVFGISTVGALGLMAVPFGVAIGYLYWRRWTGDDNSQELPDKHMYRDVGISNDIVSEYSDTGAYKAYGNEQLLREAVRKFNSFLDTEIDTERRVSVPEKNLQDDDITRIQTEVHDIHSDFEDVAYRPERFSDLVDEIDTYISQLKEVRREDEKVSDRL